MRSVFFSILISFCFPFCHGQSFDSNYLRVRTFLDSSGSMSTEKTQYYDGLGRPTLAVTNGIGLSSSLFNYTLQQYDSCGRASISWIPKTDASSFTGSDCSVTTYDALDRPVFVTTPGEDMNGRGKRIEYITNSSNSVKCYNADNMAMDRYYPACSLNGERTTDEDGHVVEVFKDLHGNLVLERRYEDNTTYNDTYYVYNSVFKLCYVLPPMCTSASTEMLNAYAYQYTYDSKGRMATKKLPGCQTCEYHYDTADRVISSKDGNGKIHFYLYDGLGRLAVQGTCDNMLANDMPVAPSKFVKGDGVCNTGYSLPYGYSLSSPVLEIANYYDNYDFLSMSPMKETVQTIGLPHLYISIPISLQTGTMTRTSNGVNLCRIFYYDRRGNVTTTYESFLNGAVQNTETTYTFTNKPLQVTSTLMKGGLTYVVTDTYNYNSETGMLESKETAYNGKTSKIEYTYDNLNNIASKTFNERASLSTEYSYNVRNWITGITNPKFTEYLHYTDGDEEQFFNGNISEIIWKVNNERCTGNASDDLIWNLKHTNPWHKYSFQYDNLNRMTNASYFTGDEKESMVNDDRYIESVGYDANSAPTYLLRYGKTNKNTYDVIDELLYTYNGNQLVNISDACSTSLLYTGAFECINKNKGDYDIEYTYDGNGNMTSDLNKGISSISYDKLDHPVQMQYSDGSVIDYVYSADGRKLMTTYISPVNNLKKSQVQTLHFSSTGFLPQASELSVNVLSENLKSPVSVVTTLSPIAHNVVKNDATLIDNISITEYLGNFIFENGKLTKILMDDGYMEIPSKSDVFLWNNSSSTDGEPIFHYFIKDHLGSNRVVLSESGSVEQTNHYYPYGGLIGDISTNPEAQKYKYNGKEYETMYRLNTYDYGARQYDPARITWDRMDQFCEKYYHINPYVYCAGNPVRFIDPDGREIDISNLCDDEQKRYLSIIENFRNNSKYFNEVYTTLKNSPLTYSICFTKICNGENVLDGRFVENNNGNGGTINLTNEKELNSAVISEEFFHAYQSDNKSLYNNGSFNKEFEAKTFATIAGLEYCGYQSYNGMTDFQRDIETYKYAEGDNIISQTQINSDSFLNEYMEKANVYAKYNTEHQIGNSNYKKYTDIAPASLIQLINSLYSKKR